MRKKHIYMDVELTPLLDEKPPKDQRPVCLNCKKMIPMRSTKWYEGWDQLTDNIPWDKRPKKWFYDGHTFFCHWKCALNYAWKAANKQLKIKSINKVK